MIINTGSPPFIYSVSLWRSNVKLQCFIWITEKEQGTFINFYETSTYENDLQSFLPASSFLFSSVLESFEFKWFRW